jgi:5-formaminoimidazole-4-carboxamide-1-beta-D-ribofuranosyl 5'-monophosphate synthetase
MFGRVLEHVGQRSFHFRRRFEHMQMVSIGKYGSHSAKASAKGFAKPGTETLEPTAQRRGSHSSQTLSEFDVDGEFPNLLSAATSRGVGLSV